MPGGRPTTYKPEYIDKIDEYLALCEDERYQIVRSDGKSGTTYENKIKVKLPSIEGFSIFIDTALTTIDSWREKNPEFSGALKKIERKQKEMLVQNGLSGDYNSTIAKLILSSNHGMAEKQENLNQNQNEEVVSGLIELSDEERDLYEKLRVSRRKRIEKTIKDYYEEETLEQTPSDETDKSGGTDSK